MGIGLSGMISGLDTDSIVEAMVGGQTAKKTKLDNKATLNKWTTTAWSDLNKKIYSFYTNHASKLRLKSSYQTKEAESSNESKVKATASSTAAIGQHTVKVTGLASSQFVTGAKLNGTYTTETRIQQLDNEGGKQRLVGQTITFKSKVGTDEEASKTITVDNNTKIKDIISAAREAGITASYDTNQKRFFFSSEDSGEDYKFTITSTAVSSTYANAKNELTNIIDPGTLIEDTDKTAYENAINTILGASSEDIEAALQENFGATDTTNNTDDQIAVYNAIKTIKELAASGLTDADEITASDNNVISKVEAYKNAMGNQNESASLAGLGLGEGVTGENVSETSSGSMVVTAAKDATAIVDGATMTSSSNTLVVNGLTLNLINSTYNESTGEYDEVTVTVGKDTKSTYDLVRNAIKEYNSLIEEMSKLYYADSARGYEPLTAEQKEAMTDDEIEQWENKIKGSLLRRDTTLGSLMSSMRSALQSTYTDSEGKKFSLSTYGIVTGNYTERGKLHIYGDSEDAIFAADEDRLKAALDEDPDKVMEAMSGIFSNLYTTLTEKCAKTSISSALTFYNDKQYTSDLKRYQSDLDEINDRIDSLKDRYYKQFTAMEKALSELQSKQASLGQMLGTSV
jgi:flagellar hook-associated protein 2